MDNILGLIMTQIFHGGPSVIAMLVFIVICLIIDRRRLEKEISIKDERLGKIVEEYYKGNISLSEALQGIKLFLAEIKLSLK